MGVITHGNTLPDSSAKDDFYALIDDATVTSIVDADIASGAAIADTKLATIATAGKVNVSALTGTIANANLAQITTAGKVSGASLVLLNNIPSGAGKIPLVNIGNLLGAGVSKTAETIYQATTDGFVYGYANETDNDFMIIEIYSDSSATPSTTVQRIEMSGATNYAIPFCVPIKKNNYYQLSKVDSIVDPTIPTYVFIPMGS